MPYCGEAVATSVGRVLVRQVLEQEAAHVAAHDGADLGLAEVRIEHRLGQGGELARIDEDGRRAVVVGAERDVLCPR